MERRQVLAKIHLVQTQNPLTDGWVADAMCGESIASCAIQALADSTEFDDLDSLLRSPKICNECKVRTWEMRYLYFVREA